PISECTAAPSSATTATAPSSCTITEQILTTRQGVSGDQSKFESGIRYRVYGIRIYASRDFIPYTIYPIPYTTFHHLYPPTRQLSLTSRLPLPSLVENSENGNCPKALRPRLAARSSRNHGPVLPYFHALRGGRMVAHQKPRNQQHLPGI